MTQYQEEKVETDDVCLENIKKKLGRNYASKIAKKTRGITNREIYDIVRGWVKNPKKINKILKAAKAVLEEEELLNLENKTLARKFEN